MRSPSRVSELRWNAERPISRLAPTSWSSRHRIQVEEVSALPECFGTRVPLLYNHSESGRVPRLPAYELGKLGYRIIGYYGHAHLAACKAARDVLATILATQNSVATWERMLPLDEYWEICDLARILEFQDRHRSGRPL